MAQVILSTVGQQVGGPVGQVIGSTIGRSIDQRFVQGLEPARQRGPRLSTLKVQGSADGEPMACVFGRARVTGQIIWAARFQEGRHTTSGGKGGPRTVEFDYSLSFAVALCEGPVDGIGRVWADGRPMDLTGVTMRLHPGDLEQAPDALIEAVEGAAPAYRGCAYVVFEDLALGPYGNRPPQLSFEVFRRPRGLRPALEDRLEGVCLIPGSGEFVLATEAVTRREGLTRTAPENRHAGDGRTDLVVSLDQLQAQCPNLKRVSLVIAWFGDDLRAGRCTIRPGVERVDKPTEPLAWSVAGLSRSEGHPVSSHDGAPAYGGTPSDETVRQAVAELKARGLEVTLYPFVLMDVPTGNGLPDPYGGPEQAAYPWRGRVRGGEASAAEDIEAVFGGPGDWGLRRLALHYAALAADAGTDGLLIGSEMRGLTLTRDVAGDFPAVEQFRALAAECRAVVGPDVRLSYAADWSEYAGLREGEDVVFHLDPLWADANIDYVGIDWYPPMGDWRYGGGGLDADAFDGPADRAYLIGQVTGGEGFDWHYASGFDRLSQNRTPIVDGAHGEDWVFRVKDLTGWWSNLHHDRVGGSRSATPTAWEPGMKPIRLAEFGCAAVDRGGNAPNLFLDPKSAESALPPFSTGARDDRLQRRVLEAVLGHFGVAANNPVSPVYAEPMLEAADVWCWDARPWPAFPGRSDVWADASAWRTGHWLNGRLSGETKDILAGIMTRGGIPEDAFTIGEVEGDIQGYVIDRPMRIRDALEPLLTGLGLIAAERNDGIVVSGGAEPQLALTTDRLALPDDGGGVRIDRRLEPRPGTARVRFIDGNTDYQTGAVVVRGSGEGGGIDLELPAVCSMTLARSAARRALEPAGAERLTATLSPIDVLRCEPGDGVTLEGRDGTWRIVELDIGDTPAATLERTPSVSVEDDTDGPRAGEAAVPTGAPFFRVLELPSLMDGEDDGRPVLVAAREPWRPMQAWAGADATALTARGSTARPATVGVLMEPLLSGPLHRWDEANSIIIRLEGVPPESRSRAAVFAGGNALAVETGAGWEIVQFRDATLIGGEVWRLSGLLRGLQGTDAATRAGAAAGATGIMVEAGMARLDSPRSERGLPLIWRAGPVGSLAGGADVSETELVLHGLNDRPWSPCHLRAVSDGDGGRVLDWTPRARIDGDRWEGETAPSDPLRFRVRVLDGADEVRAFEVEGCSATYASADFVADFPLGPDAGVRIAVAQWGERFGWGCEAVIALT